MAFYADTGRDLPAPWKPKQIIFYAEGLKVYGQIPYIHQRRLNARFYSNNAEIFGGGRLIAPSMEANYTVVPYRRADGRQHKPDAIGAFFDWLFSDKGFEWAFAVEFHKHIATVNWGNMHPETFVPGRFRPGEREQQSDMIQQFFLGKGAPCLPSSSSKP